MEMFAKTILPSVRVTALRFFTVYGGDLSRRSEMVVPQFVANARQDKPLVVFGDPSREFTHISDIVSGIHNVLMTGVDDEQPKYRQYDLSSGELTRVADLAAQILQLVPTSKSIVQMMAPRDLQQGTRAANLLPGWTPKISLSEGLKFALS